MPRNRHAPVQARGDSGAVPNADVSLPMDMTTEDIARLTGGVVKGDGALRITGVNGIREARPGDLTFIRSARYAPLLDTTQASAVLMEAAPADCPITVIEVAKPDLAFAAVLQHLGAQQLRHPSGIHPSAVIADDAQLGPGVAVDAFVRIDEGAVIGEGVILYAGVYVGAGAVIGPQTVVYPRAVIRERCTIGARCMIYSGAVIGSDGFGFAPLDGRWAKIPQVGTTVLEDDVEVGANSCVDRATFGETRIRRGTKIDNLVQIGHNVQTGEHCVIAGNAGIAGSAVLGNWVRIGAGAGIGGHIDIGDGASVAGWSGVTKSVPAGAVVSGFPAMDHAEARRVLVAQQRVPDMLRRVRHLERNTEALEKKLHEQAENNSE